MEVKELIEKIKRWRGKYKEYDIKVRIHGKDFEIEGVYGIIPNLVIHLKEDD